jgi:hypothetical protein
VAFPQLAEQCSAFQSSVPLVLQRSLYVKPDNPGKFAALIALAAE